MEGCKWLRDESFKMTILFPLLNGDGMAEKDVCGCVGERERTRGSSFG